MNAPDVTKTLREIARLSLEDAKALALDAVVVGDARAAEFVKHVTVRNRGAIQVTVNEIIATASKRSIDTTLTPLRVAEYNAYFADVAASPEVLADIEGARVAATLRSLTTRDLEHAHEADREARTYARLAAAIKRGGIITSTLIDLFNQKKVHTMNTAPTRTPLPADPAAALAAITAALELPDNADPETIGAAFDALIAATTEGASTLPDDQPADDQAAVASLTARELKICQEAGCKPADFIRIRRLATRRR